jgi:hypothetical protein
LPEIDDLAALDDAALVDADAGWAQTENAACARKTAVMAELFTRRTGLPAGERELWWVDPEAAVGAELGATQNISAWMALAQAHRGVVLTDRLPKIASPFEAGLIDDEPYQVQMSADFHPWRRNVDFLECTQAPIRPLLEQLDFIEDPSRWGYKFRFGVFAIDDHDLDVIRAAMTT